MHTIRLPAWRSALVVIAHPDDESFGLGGVLERLGRDGVRVRVLCFTRGEASTLGDDADLSNIRSRELACAADQLAVEAVTLLEHPDGALSGVSTADLDRAVDEHVGDADVIVVFEPGGVTAHPDHQTASRAAERVAAQRGLRVLEWGVSPKVAAVLNAEFGTSFVGVDGDDLAVDRGAQWRAIACHRSQSHDNPVLHRRLELQGPYDRIILRAVVDTTERSGPCAAGMTKGFVKA